MLTKTEFWRLFRFGLVGGGATIVDLVVAKSTLVLWGSQHWADHLGFLLQYWDLEHWATTVGFFVAFWVSFFGHRYVTFQQEGKISHFFLVAVAGLIIRNLILSGLLFLGLQHMVPIVIATLTVTVLTYVLSKIWVFA